MSESVAGKQDNGAHLRLVGVVDQSPLVPVKHEPALAPGLDPGAHLVEVAAAAAAIQHDVATQFNLNREQINYPTEI